MNKRISDEDLQTLRNDIKREIGQFRKGEQHHGWLQMIDNCLGELQNYRKNANTATIEVSGKYMRNIIEKRLEELIESLEITCANCGHVLRPVNKEKDNDKHDLQLNTSGRTQDKKEQPADPKE